MYDLNAETPKKNENLIDNQQNTSATSKIIMNKSNQNNDDNEIDELPLDFYPKCWTEDDVRMGVLFAPFRLRSVNPENYDGKLKFWEKLIVKYCLFKGSAEISIGELRMAFKRNEIMPYCLDVVLQTMFKAKQLQTRYKFMELPQKTWTGWAISTFIRAPISFSYQKLLESISKGDLSNDDQFLVMDVIEQQSSIMIKHFNTLKLENNIISMDDLFETVSASSDVNLTKSGIELCLHYLICKEQADRQTFRNSHGQTAITLIKLRLNSGKFESITQLDWSIYELNQTIKDLLTLIDEYDQEIVRLDKIIRESLREGKRNVAKQHLKQKHRIQTAINQKTNEMENLQNLLLQIQNTIHNRNIKETYDMASNTLRTALGDLNIDEIDDTVENVRETLEQCNEIQETLGNTSFSGVTEDDIQLEQELSELLSESIAATTDHTNELTEQTDDDKNILDDLNKLTINDSENMNKQTKILITQ